MNPPKALKIFVYYFIQNDSFDSLAEPNIFTLPNNYTNLNSVKAEHVYTSFPLKFENAYFRFFYHDKPNNMKLWMDYPPNAIIPVYENKVYVKVLRLPKNVDLRFKNDEYYSTKISKERKTTEIIKEKESVKTSKTVKGSPNLILNDPPINPSKAKSTTPSNHKINGNNSNANQPSNLAASAKSNKQKNDERQEVPNIHRSDSNIHHVETSSQFNNKNSRSSSNDKVGDRNSNRNSNEKRNTNTNTNGIFANAGINYIPDDVDFSKISNNLKDTQDIHETKYKDIGNSKEPPSNNTTGSVFEAFNSFDFTDTTSNTGASKSAEETKNNNKSDKSNQFSVLGEIFTGQDTFTIPNNNNQHSSSNNINGFSMPSNNTTPSSNHPVDQIPNNLDQDTMEERVSQVVNDWRRGLNEQKNLRYLLATFHEVWTHEPMWKEVTMQKLVEDSRLLKSYYKKAVGQTHPDKNTTKDVKRKYVANLLYNVLIEANVQLPMQ